MYRPIFIRSRIKMTLDGGKFEFDSPHVSVFGAYGLKWGILKPDEQFGKVADVTFKPRVTVKEEEREYRCEATVTRERSLHGEHMGLKFNLTERQRKDLRRSIQRDGHYPTEYIRKYPRIPASHNIQTYPLKAMVTLENPTDGSQSTSPIVFDLLNLSPNGVLISTENQLALSFKAGERLLMVLDPRGWFPVQVKVKGLICRITDDIHPKSHNIQRHFGVKFVQVDPSNRATFLELLRDILEQIRLEDE